MSETKTLHDLLKKEYGVDTAVFADPETTTVGTTPTRIFSNNPNRVSMLIMNIHALGAYIHFDSNVSLTNGIYLSPNGGVFYANWRNDMILPTRNWYGIASAAGVRVITVEVTIH